MKKKALKVISVDWIDSSSNGGWMPMKDRAYPLNLKCSTIGYLIHEDRESVRVSSSIAFDNDEAADSFNAAITIPRVAITRIRRLKS